MILEDIRSQNRSTLEAVESSREAIHERFDRFEQETGARFTVVETALQSMSRTFEKRFVALEAALQGIDQESRSRDASLELAIRDLKVNVQANSVDIRDLAGKVEVLSSLEARVSALERRGA